MRIDEIFSSPVRLRAATVIACAALAAASSLRPAQADEVRLEPGTVLEVSVVGVPDLSYRVTVNANGNASFPLLDSMRVEGLSLTEIRAKVKDELPRRIFRQRTADGRENYVSIAPEEISIDVAEYRPVYVSGDVSKPGEQRFRPGMTVRQAVALSGGYDLMRSRIANPFMESIDVGSERASVWIEHARLQARLLSMQAILEGRTEADLKGSLRAPIPADLLAEIATLEEARMKASDEDHRKEVRHLQGMIAQADAEIAALQQAQKLQQDGAEQMAASLERLRALHERKVVPTNRLVDEERQLGFATERLLQMRARLAEATRSREEARRKLQATQDERSIQLLTDIQDGKAKLEVLRARIRGLDEKLVYTGAAIKQFARADGPKPSIAIHRKTVQGMERVEADEDEMLRPGDVIEVTLVAPLALIN